MAETTEAPRRKRQRNDRFPDMIDSLEIPTDKHDAYAWDPKHPGFGVRSFRSGKKSYVVKYQVGTQQRKKSLAPVKTTDGQLDIDAMEYWRKKAGDILHDAHEGKDYVGEMIEQRKRAAEREKKEKPLVDLIQNYLVTKRPQVRPSTFREIQHHLMTLLAPLHGRAIESIGRRDILEIVDSLVAKGHTVQADRVKTNAVTFFNHCIEYDFIGSNPATGIKRRTPKEQLERERVLSMTELAAVWRATAGYTHYEAIVRLLLLCGARREEIGSLSWEEIDFDRKEIRLPKIRTKNGKPHTIFLSPPAMEILAGVTRRIGKRYLFGATSSPFDGWSKSKLALDKRLDGSVAPWVLHDLRRSLATNASDLGLATPVVIEMALGHWSGEKKGIIKVYNKSTFDIERRRLMGDWSAAVLSHVGE